MKTAEIPVVCWLPFSVLLFAFGCYVDTSITTGEQQVAKNILLAAPPVPSTPTALSRAQVKIVVQSYSIDCNWPDSVYFGYDYGATAGIDLQFGEAELPPPGIAGSCDARFTGPLLGQGVSEDYRGYVSEARKDTHTMLLMQSTPFVLRWNKLAVQLICDSAVLRYSDFSTVYNVNMTRYDSMFVSAIPSQMIRLVRYGQRSNALPIELMYRSMTTISSSETLFEWGTISETNNYGFFIVQNEQIIPHSFVAGHGTTNVPQAYSKILHGTQRRGAYRLKQVDLDGAVTYHSF